jgi:hypothetical protein
MPTRAALAALTVVSTLAAPAPLATLALTLTAAEKRVAKAHRKTLCAPHGKVKNFAD